MRRKQPKLSHRKSMDIIKQILKDYVEGRISCTNAEYRASKQLGGNWAIESINGELILTKFGYRKTIHIFQHLN